MRSRWSATSLLAVVAVMVGLAGCSGHPAPVAASATTATTASASTGGPTGSSSASPTIASSPNSTTASPSSPTSSASGPTPCDASTLALSLGAAQGAAGTIYQSVLLTNTSTAPCTLEGYPGVSFLDSTGTQVGPASDRAPGQTPQLVTLAATRGVASFTLAVHNAQSYDPGVCMPQPTVLLRVYPPNVTAPLTVSYHTSVCTVTYNSTDVGVVVSGTAGGSA
ncbi:MAG: DUF4232 domain-containing protein [Mycobacteriales bacterium]